MGDLAVWDGDGGGGAPPALIASSLFTAVGGPDSEMAPHVARFGAVDTPTITSQPQDTVACAGRLAVISFECTGDELRYQWRKDGHPIGNGLNLSGSRVAGVTTARLAISGATVGDAGLYRCIITNPCGEVATAFATLTIETCCPGDFNNDGTMNSQDFFDFLAAFFAGAPAADVNNDSAVNSQDFFDFLTAFFAGC